MHDERTVEAKQRLAEYRMELAVWPDAYLQKKPKEAIEFSHPSIGGGKVGHPVPVKTEKEISFEHLGGRCVSRSPLWAEPTESTQQHGESRAGMVALEARIKALEDRALREDEHKCRE